MFFDVYQSDVHGYGEQHAMAVSCHSRDFHVSCLFPGVWYCKTPSAATAVHQETEMSQVYMAEGHNAWLSCARVETNMDSLALPMSNYIYYMVYTTKQLSQIWLTMLIDCCCNGRQVECLYMYFCSPLIAICYWWKCLSVHMVGWNETGNGTMPSPVSPMSISSRSMAKRR